MPRPASTIQTYERGQRYGLVLAIDGVDATAEEAAIRQALEQSGFSDVALFERMNAPAGVFADLDVYEERDGDLLMYAEGTWGGATARMSDQYGAFFVARVMPVRGGYVAEILAGGALLVAGIATYWRFFR